jgi:hypothetical protein
MRKDQYIKMRNAQQYDIGWFYAYYNENSRYKLDIQTFTMYFSMINLSEVLEFLDQKYELCTLYGKDGNFIKIIN